MYLYMHIYLYTHIHIYVCAYICVYTYTHVCTYIYTYTHAHTIFTVQINSTIQYYGLCTQKAKLEKMRYNQVYPIYC